MPRYFFNRVDGSVDRDAVGSELPTFHAARAAAVTYAAKTLNFDPDLVWVGNEFWVEVEDEAGKVLFKLKVSAEDNWS